MQDRFAVIVPALEKRWDTAIDRAESQTYPTPEDWIQGLVEGFSRSQLRIIRSLFPTNVHEPQQVRDLIDALIKSPDLDRLVSLNLSSVMVKAAEMKRLLSSPLTRRLTLRYCRLTARDQTRLHAALPDCRITLS